MGTHSTDIAADHWLPTTEDERRAVREQLERVLASPLFSNSKRYPALLRYVVDELLSGRTEKLKERTLGIDVFNRDPQYDTNADPVVRVTAGEIRKRLAQYYYEPEHESEIHIELPLGAYVPEFRIRAPERDRLASTERAEPLPVIAEFPDVQNDSGPHGFLEHTQMASPVKDAEKKGHRTWLLYGAVLAVLIAVSLGAAFQQIHASQQILQQFWEPILSSQNPALLCLGDHASWQNALAAAGLDRANSKDLTVNDYIASQDNVVMTDVITLNRISATLQSLGKEYRIKKASDTDLSDLRTGPVVLVGGGNNGWTLRLTAPLRFSFALQSSGGSIVDKQNPGQTKWVVPLSTPYLKLNADYGIVARLHDSTTGQPVIIAAGLAAQGTIATGEILSNPDFLKGLLVNAPANWRRKNMEAVITTEVVNGKSGPPRVVVSYFW